MEGQENSLKPPQEIQKAFLEGQPIRTNNYRDLNLQTKNLIFFIVQTFQPIIVIC